MKLSVSTAVFFGLSCVATVQGTQDNFANATPFNYPATTSFMGFSNAAATAEPGEPSHRPSQSGGPFHSVWFNFTATTNGFATLDMAGSAYDTVLAVYVGTALTNLKRVAADDDSSEGLRSRVVLGVKAGVVYRVAVDGFSSVDTGNTNLAVTVFTPLIPRTYYAVVQSSTFEGSGLLTVTTSATGVVSGSLRVGAKTHPFTGSMDPAGNIVVWITRTTPASTTWQSPAILTLALTGGGASLNGTLALDTEETNTETVHGLAMLPAGNRFTPPPPNTRISAPFDATAGDGTFSGGNGSGGSLVQGVNLSISNVFSYTAPNPAKLLLTVNKTTGMISGSAFIVAGQKSIIRGVVINTAGFKGFAGHCSGPTAYGPFTVVAP